MTAGRRGSAAEDSRQVLVDGGAAGGRWVQLLTRTVQGVLEREGVPAAEISVTLLDDGAIRRLNREYLDRDRPTDVLAFDLRDPAEPSPAALPGSPLPVVGDIYLGLDQAKRQALREGVPLTEELIRLAVHGTLHVLGWDHPETPGARDASAMFRRQEELVEAIVAAGPPRRLNESA